MFTANTDYNIQMAKAYRATQFQQAADYRLAREARATKAPTRRRFAKAALALVTRHTAPLPR